MTVYATAQLGGGLLGAGMGFGNRLFPWARYRIFVRSNDCAAISPVWVRPAVSQLFRGGIDYRAYLRQLVLLGLFHKAPGELGIVPGRLAALRHPTLPEPRDFSARLDDPGSDGVIVFKGCADNFARLNGWHELLHRELVAITRPRYLALARSFGDVPVGMCIRLGNDFREPEPGAARLGGSVKTPVKWFAQCLALLRARLNRAVPAFVVSDGTASQLAALLEMPNVRFVRPGSAVSDLLVLSRARVLYISGASSFACWGSFLGQMPTAAHPGQPPTWWGLRPTAGQFLGEFDPSEPQAAFMEQAVDALKGGAP